MDINPCLELSNFIDIPLIYYTHLPPIFLSLLLGIFLRIRTKDSELSRIFFYFVLVVDLWLLCDIVTWISGDYGLISYFWSLFDYLNVVFFLLGLYFVAHLARQGDIPFSLKAVGFALTLPALAFVLSGTSVNDFHIISCGDGLPSDALTQYKNVVEVIVMAGLLAVGVTAWIRRRQITTYRQVILVVAAMMLFFGTFTVTDYISVQTDSYEVGLYGLLVAPIFLAIIVYSIARFQTFNAKVLGAQLLVFALVALIASEYLFVRSTTNRILVSLTLILAIFFGYTLIQSVRREVRQRERIEKLAKELEAANEQQVVLIHFITHQIKGFVTKSRNIFSMLLEGDFGQLSDTMKPMIEEGLRSDTKGVNTIQEILNAANIKSGKVTYAKQPLDFKALVAEVAKDLKPNADAKGISYTVTATPGDYTLTGDRMQLVNAIKNLIDNSIKYTPKGSVDVTLAREDEHMRLVIKDTGVGITPEDMKLLFTEGGHGKESQKVNVESTGFGLYIVKNIIEAHHGKVWAESEGAGKGSRFIVELPAS